MYLARSSQYARPRATADDGTHTTFTSDRRTQTHIAAPGKYEFLTMRINLNEGVDGTRNGTSFFVS